MTHRIARIASLVAALVLWTGPVFGQASADEQLIRGLATQFERAWNSHDMNLLGAITTEVVMEHAERHKVRFKNSVWTNERVSVQMLGPDMALVHVDWQTRGDLDFELKPWPPRTGIFSWLVVKNGGSWKIRAVQNTGKN